MWTPHIIFHYKEPGDPRKTTGLGKKCKVRQEFIVKSESKGTIKDYQGDVKRTLFSKDGTI